MSASTTSSGGKPPSRGLLSFLAGAQEVGLLVVILIMSIGLTLASGSTTRKDREPLPAGSTIVRIDDNAFKATVAGVTTTYQDADGHSFAEPDAGKFILIHDRVVNRFLNSENLINLLTFAAFIAIMAVGMTGVIIMNGIDLSIGSIYGLSAVVGASALSALATAAGGQGVTSAWVAVPLGMAVCMFTGGVCGAINGIGTVGLKVHPFIITLGGMAVYRGIAFIISKGESIAGLPDSYRDAIRASWGGSGGMNVVPTLVMVATGLAGAAVLSRTVWGRRVFAIGGNEVAAKYAGVPVGLIKISVFTAAGALAGLSASLIAGHLGGASSDTGKGYELDVIAAAVVGGAALSGGRGSALGAVLGAIVIQLINNGFDLVGPRFGIDQNYRQIVIGLAIVLAVVIDQAKHRLGGPKRH